MQHTKSEIYLHFVWATYHRLPLITPEFEPALYAVLKDQAQLLGCQVLALGGMPDHIHLLLKMPAKYSPSKIMQQIKGASSAWARVNVRPQTAISAEPFGWQDHYGVFSISRSHLKRVTVYVNDQKRRHASANTWSDWEETEDSDTTD